MREVELAKRETRKKTAKPLPYAYKTLLYIAVGVLLLFTIITKNDFVLLLFFMALSTAINYETNMTSIRFNPQPEVFASLVLAKMVGFHYSFIMLILPTVLVDIYTARLDPDTFISLALTAIISFLMATVHILDFLPLALILVTMKFIIGSAINLALDLSMEELLFEHVLGFVVNAVLLLAFGSFLFAYFA
ncbi:MAG: hypothetical protein HGA85_03220 [Nanoarchaeota archaeon]|nr:hypothetical protein [Nanoarchaeota archaeon]